MIKEVIAVGKTIMEAKENARLALGADELAEVQYEIQDAGTKGFLGFLSRPAKVRAFIELPDVGEKRQRGDKKKGDKKNNNNNTGNNNNKKNNNGNQKKHEDKPKEPKAKAEAPEKPKSVVIPEEELKMERRIVEDGELLYVARLSS